MWCFNNFTIFIILLTIIEISKSQSKDYNQHECLRSCSDEESSKKLCHYEFFVTELPNVISIRNESKIENESETKNKEISSKSYLGINGKSPGPSISVCLGDTIEVLVYNRLGTDELSFHWHGMRQKSSLHMDGVPMVSQCSILPFGGFRYKIKAEKVGTYIYYAHSVSQQGNGVYGSLTVRGLQDDPRLERILLLSSRSATPSSLHLHLHSSTPNELLFNGQVNETIIKVSPGEKYTLRLINANAYNCPVLLSIAGHHFRVSTIDGNMVEPVIGKHVVSFPGERFDLILEANQLTGKYLVDIKGLQDCQNLRQQAPILYDGTKLDSPLVKDEELLKIDDYAMASRGHHCHEISRNFICALDLKGLKEVEINADQVIYIPFDVNDFPPFTDEMSDYRYNFYGCPYYPSELSISKEGARIAQINGMSFKYPTSPLLSQPENTPKETICSLEKRSKECLDTPQFCECIQIIEVPVNKNIDIVLIDQGFGGNTSYTFHVHGYNASILGRNSFERPITKEEVIRLDHDKKLLRNFLNPPQKDSFVVPNKGYVILRLYTDNLGYWLWEARSTGISPRISGPVMQFLLKVGNRESFLPVPLNFPTCGNNKHPDMVFETN